MNIWQETINPDTGESSLKEHHVRTVWLSCKPDKHYYKLTNSSKRECTCKKCGAVTTFVLGMQFLVDGKITSIK